MGEIRANVILNHGARTFVARAKPPENGVWLSEGPIDPLAPLMHERLDNVRLHDASVIGAAGARGVTLRTVDRYRPPVRLALDNDETGRTATSKLRAEYRRHFPGRRTLHCEPPTRDKDWTETLEVIALRVG